MKECFVYGLYDPNTNEIFYVGKGTGYRDKCHIKPSSWQEPKKTCNPFLYYKIKNLMENNTPPETKKLKENLSEEEAYQYENELIKKHGRRFSEENGKLFNISEYKGGSSIGISKPWTDERLKKHIEQSRKKRKYDPEYEELYDDYIIQRKTRKEIAKENGCSEVLVKKRLSELGIFKPKEKQYPERRKFSCKKCQKMVYVPKSCNTKKYCSRNCYLEDRYG